MHAIEFLLTPIMWLMQHLVMLFQTATGSFGLAIIGLSIVVRLALTPIFRIAAKAEQKEQGVQAAMAPQIAEAKRTMKGREQFERIDEIYQAHGYHPIQSVSSLAPIALQIPFLLSALFLLTDFPPLQGKSFLFIENLGAPDGLLTLGGININLLPILLTAVAIFESSIRPEMTQATRVRFLIVAGVIAVLIYGLPAAVCLYWLTSNLWSLGSTTLKLRNKTAEEVG